ncbi:Zinc metalloprotease-like protein [Venustampulla echinocandica]|uniref:Zinc metalloprotease-like protein n=1 Tax=Venustampulla echinocandica TaxID=2656787 RepID=A0A370U0U7_9HELO|nr:Zinc metalloprotease-like protein [Venustampulla echinocandica]RDL41373.1 Zinc metalloprotease-like protein [Venustampulla echinocandica]
MSNQTKKTHFRTVQRFQTEYAPVSISQYVSERTGMHVVVADQKGPKVEGYFTLATEIFDDSGSPHTLEHLIFMGSKSYQYKGLLDKLASRAYSNTNAWTATDHTAYTLDTAGWEGFAQILPVYLEHVILPTLTDEACYTEVHHIDGDGNDAGVVYSEMQGVQNNGGEIMDIRARRLLYPENVGFRYETGGLMENLRVLTADRIREFHKEMYQPKNLCLVLVGEVDQENLLQILDEFEDGILNDIPSPDTPFKRPWVESPQPPVLKQTIVEPIEFPEEDESTGEISIAFLGPNCNNPVDTAALNVLLTYLAGSSVSVLENIMVEKEALASSVIHQVDWRPNSIIWLQPSGVATEKLAHVEQRLFEILKDVASNPLDMSYMLDCVKRERRRIKFQAESSGGFYVGAIINDFLFGKRDGSTLKDMSTLAEYTLLEKWTDGQWREFLRKWISDAPHISLLGTPSKEMAKKITETEEKRIAARKEELGPEGLAKLTEQLKAAIAKNDIEIPTSLLQKWPVPSVESIHFIESKTARSGLARDLGTPSNNIQDIIGKPNPDVPLFVQFEHVPTNFVHITILLGTSQIATEHRPLLPLFIDNFFNTPIMRDGKQVGFEEVVTQLEQDTISYSMNGGGRVSDAEGLVIQFQVEPEKYAAAIEWIRALMFDSIFDETRLTAGIAKILADIPESKRSGNSMMYAVDSMIHLDNESNVKARGTLVKAIYMKRLRSLLMKNPKLVISWLEALRKSLFAFENMRTLVIANIESLPNPVDAWKPLIANLGTTKPLSPLVKLDQRLSPDGETPGNYGAVIVPMATIDSSFLLASEKGPNSYTDPILPALMVALSFLDAVEGPVWTAVRGTGLAYGASFRRDIDGGFVQLSIYRSPDAYRAFAATKAVLESYIDGTAKFEQYALEGAVSQIVTGFADEQPTMAAAGQFHFVDGVVRGVADDYNQKMLKQVRAITVDQIRAVMKDVLMPIFVPGKSNIVVTCAPIMEEGLVKDFTDMGFKTQTQPLSSFHESYGLEAGEGEEDDEDSDGSDEGDAEMSDGDGSE